MKSWKFFLYTQIKVFLSLKIIFPYPCLVSFHNRPRPHQAPPLPFICKLLELWLKTFMIEFYPFLRKLSYVMIIVVTEDKKKVIFVFLIHTKTKKTKISFVLSVLRTTTSYIISEQCVTLWKCWCESHETLRSLSKFLRSEARKNFFARLSAYKKKTFTRFNVSVFN